MVLISLLYGLVSLVGLFSLLDGLLVYWVDYFVRWISRLIGQIRLLVDWVDQFVIWINGVIGLISFLDVQIVVYYMDQLV